MKAAARTATHAVRMDAPFVVWDEDGPHPCEDGWLAVDAEGEAFGIEAATFAREYRPQLGMEVWP